MRLGDVCSKIGSGATPRGGAASYLDQGPYALVRSQNVYNHGFEREGLAFIDKDQAKALESVRLREDDVLLNITGESVGRSCQVPPSVLPARVNQHVAIVRAEPAVLDPLFLRYALISPETQQKLAGLSAAGATRRALTKAMIESLVIRAPRSLEMQRRIANALGALDDKIELNRRMSETLDQMSQAIYQAWFQAFAPEMDLPHGWRRAPLSEFFDLGIGGAWGEESRTDKATISVHSLRGIDCHNLAEVQLPDVPVRWISERQLESRNITSGTILIEGSGSFCGRSLVWTESYNRLFEQPVVYSNFVKRLSPKVDSAQAIVAAFGLREAYRKGVVQAYRTGTAFPNLDVKGLLASLEVVVPTAEVAQRFVEIYSPERRVLTLLENNTLRQLRDTLLPKLLTGEIRVLEAEQLVSEVA